MVTVGEILKNERERRAINLTDVEKAIKIRLKFLQAVEENRWDYFSSKIYIAGIIKNYSDFLGLDAQKMAAFFRRDYEKKEEIRFKTRVASKYLTPETKKIAMIGLVALFLTFFAYFGYQLKTYLSPPSVVIISPKETQFTKEDKIKIEGKTEKDAMVSIFGERVYQNREGVFEYDFPLKNGKNVLTIEIVGANGKKTVITKTYTKNNPF